MKKLIVLFVVLGTACMQDDPEIGSDFFDDVSFEIVAWDTLSMNMYTVHYDSVRTNGPERLLVGKAAHQELDQIETEFYFQLNPGFEYSSEELKDADYEDAYLTLYYDSYFYGDTTQLMALTVHELAEELELDDDSRLYNNSVFEVRKDEGGQPIVMGFHEFDPRPTAKDSIEIRLTDEFAGSLFDYLKSDQIAIDDLLDSLRGFRIKSSEAYGVVGFYNDLHLKLNYLDRSESIPVERTLTLSSDSTVIQFNHIEAEGFDELFPDSEEDQLASVQIDNQAFIQAGMGLAIKVELPYLRQLLLTDDPPVIDEANLELVIGNELPEETHMLLAGLTINKVNHKNEVLLTYETTPELVLDLEYDEERKYVIDITEFVTEQLSVDLPDNEDALVIQFPGEYTTNTVNHLIVSDQDLDESKVIINLLNIK